MREFTSLIIGLSCPVLGGLLLPYVWTIYLSAISHLDKNWGIALFFIVTLGAVFGLATGIVISLAIIGSKQEAKNFSLAWGVVLFIVSCLVSFGMPSSGVAKLINNAPLILWSLCFLIYFMVTNRNRSSKECKKSDVAGKSAL